MNALSKIMKSQGYALLDGATGTNLFAKGLTTGDAPELWNVDQPDKITQLHDEFIDAGSDILLTNSFGGTSYRLKLHDAQDRVHELNQAAAQIARACADKADRAIVVAGSMGPTGELFEPLGALEDESATAAFAAQAQALAEGGADILWIETMSSIEEVTAAVKGAQTTNLPVYATMTFDTAGRTMMGLMPGDFAKQAQELGLQGFGANCGIGPSELLDSVFGMTENKASDDNISLIAKGNCGIPSYVEGEIHYEGTAELMAIYAKLAYQAGARIIGGCCGTTASHIAAMKEALMQVVQDAPDRPATRQDAADALGVPWDNIPQAPEGQNKSRTRRRRRGAGESK